MNDKVAVVLNGPKIPFIEENDLLCADGAYARVVGAQKRILAVIGDMDSLTLSVDKNIPRLTLPTDKDYTDGEKVIRFAKEQGIREVVIYGADGGRSDMQYCNLILLKIACDIGLKATVKTETEEISYTEHSFTGHTKRGKRVSVLPYGGKAELISSTGLFYPLDNLTLTPADTVGVSNRATEEDFSLLVHSGGVFVFKEI